MKNKVLILLFAIGGLVSSCSDAYDIPEKGVIYDEYEAFRKAQDVERGLNVIYASIPATTEISLGSVFTDEVAIGLNNGGQGLINGQYGFLMESNNGYAESLWGSYYTMINRINRLEVISKKLMAENSAEANAHRNNLSELYVLRAYAHYKLFAYFTPNYTNESGMSAIILDHVPPLDYSYSLPRNTVKQVKDFILADLVRAEQNRTSTGWRNMDYVNAGVIDAIRVKLFSMTEQWDDVLTYGERVMTAYTLSGLDGAGEYSNAFSKTPSVRSNGEVIFRSKVTPNSGPSVVSIWYSVRAQRNNGSFFYEMGRSLYNELDKLDAAKTGTLYAGQRIGETEGESRDDVRYNASLLGVVGNSPNGTEVLLNYETASQSDYNSKDVLLIGKYPGISGADLKNDIYLFRTADILLAMAEARAAKGQLTASSTDPDDLVGDRTNVYSILYTLRFNRWIPAKVGNVAGISMPSITSQQSAFNAILNERRVEFAFEGYRYLDMKRLGVKAGSPGFTRYSKDCAVNGACNLPANDHRMTLPIPVGEMNGNNTLTADSQNPGY